MPILCTFLFFSLLLGVLAKDCPKGSFISAGICQLYPFNTISTTTNAASCVPCVNQTAANPRRTECKPCGLGRVYRSRPRANKVCSVCPFDTYNDKDNATSCTACPPRTRGPRRGTSLFHCMRCPEGLQASRRPSGRVQCIKCEPGFSTVEDQLVCLPCPSGTFFDRFGNGTCLPCAPGLFASATGSTFCSLCPTHTFTIDFGRSACKVCPPGTEAPNFGARQCRPACQRTDPSCLSCPPGSGENRATGECERCAPGFIGQIRTGTECYPCPFPARAGKNKTVCGCPDKRPPLLKGKCDRP